MYSAFLGINISKLTFDIALIVNNQTKINKFDNNFRGFVALRRWIQSQGISSIHTGMEATGGHETKLAEYLYRNNFKVSVVNPARIKGFSMSKLCRVKTDSKLIAHFCQAMIPELWHPTPGHIKILHYLFKFIRLNTKTGITKNKKTYYRKLYNMHHRIIL